MRPQFESKKKYLAQTHPDEAEKLNEASFLVDSIYNVFPKIPSDIVKKTLEQWHQEQPEIFNALLSSDLPAEEVPASVVDLFTIARRARGHLLNNKFPVEFVDRVMTLHHLNTIIDTLKQLGVKQTLSDKQIDSLGQLQADETQKAYKEIIGQGPAMKALFEEIYSATD